MDFNKKENREFFNDKLFFKTIGIVSLIFICVLLVADIKIYQKKHEFKAQIIAYKNQIEDIQKSSQTLKDEIANSNNVDYLEKMGYEQFNQARLGETEYMFVGPEEGVEKIQPQPGFWNVKSWWNGITGWIKSIF